MLPRDSRLRNHPRALVAAGAFFAAMLAIGVLALLLSRDAAPPAGSSELVALRTLRLAGYDHAVVGEAGGEGVVRLSVPSVASPADVELSWQTALAIAGEAYPRAPRLTAQVFRGDQPLVEVSVDDAALVRRDASAGELRSAARFTYLMPAKGEAEGPRGEALAAPEAVRAARALRVAEPEGASALPRDPVCVDLDVSGAYLDELNRASGVLTTAGPEGAAAIAGEWSAARRESPGRPAVPPGADAAVFHARRLLDSLEESPSSERFSGVEGLAARAREVVEGRATGDAAEMRAWTFTAEAVAGGGSRSVLGETAEAARRVREAPVPDSGAEAAAVRVASGDAAAPRDARTVAAFDRVPAEDATASAGPSTLPGAVIARAGGRRIVWSDDGERDSVSPDAFLAYVRADGRTFWLAGQDGPVALTDGTLRGWAFTIPRAWIVDPEDVGRVLGTMPTG